MASKIDIFSSEWCDLIFEEKNQKYGAFTIRKESAKRHIIGLIIVFFVFIVGFSMPKLIDRFVPKRVDKDVTVRTLSDLNLDKPKEQENILKELPPPPPPLRNTIKFTPPVIKPDEQVSEEEEPKMQTEVIDNKAAIGAVTYDKGTDDVTAPLPTDDKQIVEEEEIFQVVEQMPEYPGGTSALFKWINKNIKYPDIARENGITGVVMVTFVVDGDGSIKKATIARGLDPNCDAEALRVIREMPKWKPGKQGGKPVRVYFTLPIRFVLQ
jgi:periplasmic protein TonB